MFLAKEHRLGFDSFIFTVVDPRLDGFDGEVKEDVQLDYYMHHVHSWPSGEPTPSPQLGIDPNNSKHYKVFRSPDELHASRYELVDSNAPLVLSSWADYRKIFPFPLDMVEAPQDVWFDYLDAVDAATLLRSKKRPNGDPPPPGRPLVQIAEWVAKRHLNTDVAIREVRYLPKGAPANEIRLLEVNDRYTVDEGDVEPIDFGIDVHGEKLKLCVADVGTSQMENLEAHTLPLPKGWELTDSKKWGRRG